MKKTIFYSLLFFVSTFAMADLINDFDDLQKAKHKYDIKEATILNILQNQGRLIAVPDDWRKALLEQGFSEDFSKKVEAFVGYRVNVRIEPAKSGEMVSQVPEIASPGTKIQLHPRGVGSYEFDRWEGDCHGNDIVTLRVYRNLDIVAHFRQVQRPQDKPVPLSKRELREARKEGHTYTGEVIGVVNGEGIFVDWGYRGEMNYSYLYHINYTSKILANDGITIEEEREFTSVIQQAVISKAKIRIDLASEYETLKTFMKTAAKLCEDNFGKAAGQLARKYSEKAEREIESRLQQIRKFYLSKWAVDMLLKGARLIPDSDIIVDILEALYKGATEGKLVTYAPNVKILEGKKLRLVYENGIGLTKVEVIGDGHILTAREKELIYRALYLADYYIFRNPQNPQKSPRPQEEWQVDARTLAGVLDPGMRGYAQGKILLRRSNNMLVNNRMLAAIEVQGGDVAIVSDAESEEKSGTVSFEKGRILYDLQDQYVIEAHCQGTLEYKSLSKDHLFFQARMTSRPKFSVMYHATCGKSE